jgi:hypothetical protein
MALSSYLYASSYLYFLAREGGTVSTTPSIRAASKGNIRQEEDGEMSDAKVAMPKRWQKFQNQLDDQLFRLDANLYNLDAKLVALKEELDDKLSPLDAKLNELDAKSVALKTGLGTELDDKPSPLHANM